MKAGEFVNFSRITTVGEREGTGVTFNERDRGFDLTATLADGAFTLNSTTFPERLSDLKLQNLIMLDYAV